MVTAEPLEFSRLQPGDRVSGLACLWSCQVRTTRQNVPFLQIELRDVTRTILPGVMWDADGETAPECPVVILIDGEVGQFQGAPQIKLFSMSVTDQDVLDYLPTTYRHRAELIDEFTGIIEIIEDEPLRNLVHACLEQAPGFWSAPAAIAFHGAYRCGLLEHTLHVTRICLHAADIYGDRINRDLLIAAAALHDIGKSDAYLTPESREPIEDERLIGHVVRGAMLVARVAQELEYDGSIPLADLLHALVSHHGEHEFGAPVVPGTAEALILSNADGMDADVTGYFDLWRDKPEGEEWTYSRQGRRWVRKPTELHESITGSHL